MSLESKLIKQMDIERNIHSYELFNKPESQLEIAEFNLLSLYMYDLEHPVWKDIIIDGKNTGYKISNTGEVKGKNGSILKKDITNTGYFRINGYYDKQAIHLSIHREVGRAFIPNPENKPFINHINGNKQFNWWRNLEWVTHKENMIHAVNTFLIDCKGEKHPENVYTEKQIRRACELLQDPKNKISDIVNKTGINRSILYSIRTGHSWSQISSEYNIPKPVHQLEFSDSKLDQAAKLLSETKLSYDKIYDKTGIPPRTLIKIVYGSPKYMKLSKRYDVSKFRKIKSEYYKNNKQYKVESSTTIPLAI